IAEEIRSAVEKYGKNPVQTTAVKANPDVVKFEKLDMTSPENSVSRKRSYQPFGIKPLGTSESFYESYSRNKIRNLMKSIIETEAPISRKSLFKKVLSAWGITRSGNKVESILDNAITFVDKSETYENGSIFYWKKIRIRANTLYIVLLTKARSREALTTFLRMKSLMHRLRCSTSR
ncbi:MAG: DUF3320 domain-containing protein, partial [Ruminococcus sp.]|nr:DUF3320 domain-containing protein [Ruminococcus sp.]